MANGMNQIASRDSEFIIRSTVTTSADVGAAIRDLVEPYEHPSWEAVDPDTTRNLAICHLQVVSAADRLISPNQKEQGIAHAVSGLARAALAEVSCAVSLEAVAQHSQECGTCSKSAGLEACRAVGLALARDNPRQAAAELTDFRRRIPTAANPSFALGIRDGMMRALAGFEARRLQVERMREANGSDTVHHYGY